MDYCLKSIPWNLFPASDPINLFPNTQSKPATRLRELSRKHQIHLPAIEFLSDYPDLNIPTEIATEALYLDWKDKNHFLQKEEFGDHDPLFNQLLAITPNNAVEPELLVCSVGGEIGNELYISSLIPPSKPIIGDFGGRTKKVETENLTFRPSLLPAHVFQSPILQIHMAPPYSNLHETSAGSLYAPWIAIRTSAGTTICSIVSSKSSPGREYGLELIYDIKRDEVGKGFQHSDVCFNPRKRSEALIVDRRGNVFLWKANPTKKNWKQSAQSCEMIASNLESSAPKFKSTPSKRDDFWRLTWGAEDSIAFLISNTILYRLDLALDERTELSESGFHLPTRVRHQFTSIIGFNSSESYFPSLYISTPASILVFDQRNPTRPILVLDHHFNSDFTLSLAKSFVEDNSFNTSSLILSSQKERISINIRFDTSNINDVETDIILANQPRLIESSLPSGTLPSTSMVSFDLRSIGGVFESWSWDQNKPMIIFERGDRGEIWARFFSFEESRKNRRRQNDPLILVKRLGLLRELESNFDSIEDVGKLGEPEMRVENFGAIYRAAANGTFFKQPPLEPDALGKLALLNLKEATKEDGGLYPDVGVSSNIITTSNERARPSINLGLKYFSRIQVSAECLRTSLILRTEFREAVKSFNERASPSIDLSPHIRSHFCSSLQEVSMDEWEDEDEEALAQADMFVGPVLRWEESANNLADRYLPSSSARDQLDHLSGRRYERVHQAIQNSSDQVVLDLILASQVWLPRKPLQMDPSAHPVLRRHGGMNEEDVSSRAAEWKDDPLLQDPPELHFSVLSPNMETIAKALPTFQPAKRWKPSERDHQKGFHADGRSRNESRFSSRSPSVGRSGNEESGSDLDLASDQEDEITAEELGLKEGELSTIFGSKLLLSEWHLGTDPNDYSYREPYEEIEFLKTGRESSESSSNIRDRSRSQSSIPRSTSARSSRTPGFSASQPLPEDSRRNVIPLRREFHTPTSRFGSDSPAPGSSSQAARDQLRSSSSQSQLQHQSQSQLQSQSQSQSQAAMASQFIPGRFATRPPDSSKKKKKKRKKGF